MKVNNKNRLRTGMLGSTDKEGNNGVFMFQRARYALHTVCSDTMGWEHVSVSRSDAKMPTWLDMCFIKEKFWSDEDTIMQLHPPKADWINNHAKCLHLWRPTSAAPANQIPLPPAIMVGIKGLDSQDAKAAADRLKLERNL